MTGVCPGGWGSLNGYRNHACRCDECRAAVNVYMRDYQRRRKTGDVRPMGRYRLPAEPLRGFSPPPSSDQSARRAYYRALRNGWVSDLWADRFAARAGLHVLDLWPDYFERVA